MAVDGSRLKTLPLFARLSDRERDEVAQQCHAVVVQQGDTLLDEGYQAYEFFVIEEGTAAVVRAGKHLRDVGAGDFLGEIALLRGDPRTASVIATSAVRAIAMSAQDFRDMIGTSPKIARLMEESIEERLKRDRLFGLGDEV
ncbi:MAG TPA: cyclic nucleotide-binding domain-containing protein [Thermoleophilaceae bacterium]